MSFFRRILSGEYRRGVAAEGAGDYGEAARHYALAGERDKVAEMHLLRSGRAANPAEEIDALRDGLRWAEPGSAVRPGLLRALGRALLRRARAEGIATEKDRDTVREAAARLDEAGDHREAGEAWELLGDDAAASRAYERGGLLEAMEQAMARDEARARAARGLKRSFEEYELHFVGGDRDAALAALRRCIELAETKGDYRRLLDELEARRIVSGAITLRRKEQVVVACGGIRVLLGRGAESHLALRSGGVSRAHAEIVAAGGRFTLRDAGSRHGTWLADLPLCGEVPLEGEGRFRLGADLELSFRTRGPLLRLEVARGLDRGTVLLVAQPDAPVPLDEDLGLAARLRFHEGRPWAEASGDRPLHLGGTRIPHPVQLIRGDLLSVADVEVEVL
jgi:tetratricopeptide (TPR) repeat protein